MKVEIIKGPGNAAANVTLGRGDSCYAEGGAMLAMRGNVNLTTSTKSKGSGGVLAGLKRLVAGESFFINTFTGTNDGDQVLFAPTLPGDMLVLEMGSVGIIAESGSFVTAASGVSMDLGWQGFKSLFSGEGLFWLQLKGSGPVVLSSFGSLYAVKVDGEYIVDSGHIIAFEETLDFKISKAGASWFSSFLGGEGFVCRFKGSGTVWCQSHQVRGFGMALRPLLRAR